MEQAVAPGAKVVLPGRDLSAFEEALRMRRNLVYDYLDSWPGAASFRPTEIHDALFSYIKRRGKALRPALLLLSCAAVGGDEASAIPAAAAVEVFQTWTLVHDDIIDRDDMRRGKPTVHAEYAARGLQELKLDERAAVHYGTTVGILAGDLQHSWCYALLADLSSCGVDNALVLELVRRMATSLTPQLLEGEMLDVQFALPGAEMPSERELLDMLGKKTAALLEYTAWCGARIGLGGRADIHGHSEALGRFARLCGIGFQLQDDVLGLVSEEKTLGKPVGSDLREGKLTCVVSRALGSADATQRGILLSVLGNSNATQQQISAATEVLHATNAIGSTEQLANSYIEQGLQQLSTLPSSEARDLLGDWAAYLLARKY